MNNALFLFVGKSASGKTSLANLLEERYECKQVQSYTTRLPRYDGEVGHIFVSKEEFDNLGGLAAYTMYNGNEYGTTFKQLEECDIYVIDVPGVKTLLEKEIDRPIVIIYFNASTYSRINRMIERGDCDTQIVARLLQDEKDDWLRQLNKLVWNSSNVLGKNVCMYEVDANEKQSKVLNDVMRCMRQHQIEDQDIINKINDGE